MSALLLCHLLMGDVDRANENASMAGKKTIQPNDVIIALKETEFEFMIPRLEAELKSKWPRCLSCIFSFPSLESCPRTLHSHSSRFPPATIFFLSREQETKQKGFRFQEGLPPRFAAIHGYSRSSILIMQHPTLEKKKRNFNPLLTLFLSFSFHHTKPKKERKYKITKKKKKEKKETHTSPAPRTI